MDYRLHVLDSLGNIAATVSFDCDSDERAIGLLRDISPICVMELWRDGRRLVQRAAKAAPATRHGAGVPHDELAELERRIHEQERNLVLLRADHERLASAGRSTQIVEGLLATVEDTLRTMKDYRLLLVSAALEPR
jgi:hypothetical protein